MAELVMTCFLTSYIRYCKAYKQAVFFLYADFDKQIRSWPHWKFFLTLKEMFVIKLNQERASNVARTLYFISKELNPI